LIVLARVLIPACLLLAATGGALAQDGCAPSVPTVTPDGSTTSIFFDNFVVTAGSGGKSTDTSTCNVHVPVQLPKADSIGVYKVDYRGGVQLVAGQTAQLTVAPGVGPVLHHTFQGDDQEDYFLSQLVGSGRTGGIDLSMTLDLEADQLGDALAALDSADVTTVDYTSFSSVSAAIDELAAERAAVITHLGGSADLLLGFTDPIDGSDDARLLAAAGSAMVGAQSHQDLGGGFTLLTGAAYVQEAVGGADVSGFPLLAGGIRYIRPDAQTLRPFAEAGVWGSPDLAMHFSRQYENSLGVVDSSGDASGSLLGVYGRLGVLYAPNPTNEIVFSGTLSQSWLRVGAYAEPGSAGNLFPATVAASSSSSEVAKATVAWTSAVTSQFDFTLSAAAGRTFGGARNVIANVDWVGPVTGSVSDLTFIEYGARVGWKLTPNATLDGFVFGTTGDKIGTHTQYGGAIRFKF
jgi:hypothetical protein